MGQPLSHYFYVMTNGYGAMPDYAAQVSPADRWAIAAYIRALQLSQNAAMADVPAGTQVQDLKTIAVKEGLPASYAGPWPTTDNTNVDAAANRNGRRRSGEGTEVRSLSQPEKNPTINAPGSASTKPRPPKPQRARRRTKDRRKNAWHNTHFRNITQGRCPPT